MKEIPPSPKCPELNKTGTKIKWNFLSFSLLDCNQPHTLPGAECYAKIPKYHWNNEVQVCVEVIFGGCRETKNNFNTLEECENTAKPVCLPEY